MNLEDHIGKQIESHSLTPAGGVVLTKFGGLYTVSPKLVEPDRNEGAVHLETTRARRNSLDTTTGVSRRPARGVSRPVQPATVPRDLGHTPRQRIALTGAPPVNKPQ